MHYANTGEIGFSILSGEIDPAAVAIGWLADEWGCEVWIYEAAICIYEYSAGNSPYDSGQTVPLDRAMEPSRLRRYAERTAKEMAEELGLKPDCVFEEEG